MAPRPFTSRDFIRQLLRPVVKLCLKRGVKFQEFGEIARHVFIDCADEELTNDGYEVNVSRLSLATGLQRRDVTRLWDENAEVKGNAGVLFKVIGQWRADKRFAEKNEKPKPLSYKGLESDFAQLVRSISQDLNVYTVLFELERLGLVEKKGEILLLTGSTVVPQKDLKRGSELLSADMQDIISAVDENIFATPETPNHHIKTHYDNIVVEALPRIREWFLEKGEMLHDEARKFISKFDKDINPKLKDQQGKARVALGSFSITEIPQEKKGKTGR